MPQPGELTMFKQKAFSLIEIIIAISIISLFSGIAIVYYNDFSEQKKLDYETKKFVDTLELAKIKANSNDNSLCNGIAATPEVNNYSVNLTVTSYQLMPNCVVGTPQPVNYQLASKIQIAITPIPTSIIFYPSAVGASASCVNVRATASNKCNYIKIEQSGVISDGNCASGTCPCSCPATP